MKNLKLTISENGHEFEIPSLEQPAFGKWLVDQRLKANCSQQEVADICTVTRQAVYSWETQKTVPTLENLTKLAEFFCVDRKVQAQNDKLDDIADRMNKR